jgi:hypothetical protein
VNAILLNGALVPRFRLNRPALNHIAIRVGRVMKGIAKSYDATVPKALPRPLERLRRVLTGSAEAKSEGRAPGAVRLAPAYQRVICRVAASHRKLEAKFSKI